MLGFDVDSTIYLSSCVDGLCFIQGVAGAISPRVGPGPTPSPRPSDGRPQSARSEREKQEQVIVH